MSAWPFKMRHLRLTQVCTMCKNGMFLAGGRCYSHCLRYGCASFSDRLRPVTTPSLSPVLLLWCDFLPSVTAKSTVSVRHHWGFKEHCCLLLLLDNYAYPPANTSKPKYIQQGFLDRGNRARVSLETFAEDVLQTSTMPRRLHSAGHARL